MSSHLTSAIRHTWSSQPRQKLWETFGVLASNTRDHSVVAPPCRFMRETTVLSATSFPKTILTLVCFTSLYADPQIQRRRKTFLSRPHGRDGQLHFASRHLAREVTWQLEILYNTMRERSAQTEGRLSPNYRLEISAFFCIWLEGKKKETQYRA